MRGNLFRVVAGVAAMVALHFALDQVERMNWIGGSGDRNVEKLDWQ